MDIMVVSLPPVGWPDVVKAAPTLFPSFSNADVILEYLLQLGGHDPEINRGACDDACGVEKVFPGDLLGGFQNRFDRTGGSNAFGDGFGQFSSIPPLGMVQNQNLHRYSPG